MDEAAILEVDGLTTEYGGGRSIFGRQLPAVRAVDGVGLALKSGKALGLVGESGCGKSTLAKTILGLTRERTGTIKLDGKVVSGLAPRRARAARAALQYVHQDPGAALDPWWTIGYTLDETLRIYGHKSRPARTALVDDMLTAVGLSPDFRSRYPHELSGGQQRRVGLARILALKPKVVILDEPTSGLDLSVQATVLGVIDELRRRFGLTYLFVSHDLSVVRRMCEDVAVMYLGRIVELGPREEIFSNPRHPYTQALLAAAPGLKPRSLNSASALPGEPPSPAKRLSGCSFRGRCTFAVAECADERPPLRAQGRDHLVACIRVAHVPVMSDRASSLHRGSKPGDH